MTPGVPVTKMHGTLNDFLVIDERVRRTGDLFQFARHLCDRRAGIGADGLLAIEPSTRADIKMRIVNADGSEAETCGNGLRCVARYLNERGEGDAFSVETLAGVNEVRIIAREPEYRVRVSMGVPILERRPLPFENAVFVSLGNPHVVIFTEVPDAFDLQAAATQLAAWPGFERGANVHVAASQDRGALLVRHWERGVGLTQACGSGAVACAFAAHLRGLVTTPVEVYVPGGRLFVEWDARGVAFLSGPAERVFETLVEAPIARTV